jgi:RNase P protein component
VHQPERGGVEDEAHLIGGRAVTRHAIRRQLRLVHLRG